MRPHCISKNNVTISNDTIQILFYFMILVARYTHTGFHKVLCHISAEIGEELHLLLEFRRIFPHGHVLLQTLSIDVVHIPVDKFLAFSIFTLVLSSADT